MDRQLFPALHLPVFQKVYKRNLLTRHLLGYFATRDLLGGGR